jgi:hypothetical protein
MIAVRVMTTTFSSMVKEPLKTTRELLASYDDDNAL